MWTVGAGGVDGVDRVAALGQHHGPVVDVARVGRIGRVELGGDGELAGAQHALEPAARGVAGQGRQRVGRARPAGGRSRGAQRRARHGRSRTHPQPGRAALAAMVDRRLQLGDRVALRHPARALPGLHPDAAHLRLDLAMAVGAHAAAGTVAHLLRAVHRAGHAGRAQHALAAHLAVEQQALDAALDQRPPARSSRCEADALRATARPRHRPTRNGGRTAPRSRHGGPTRGGRRTSGGRVAAVGDQLAQALGRELGLQRLGRGRWPRPRDRRRRACGSPRRHCSR